MTTPKIIPITAALTLTFAASAFAAQPVTHSVRSQAHGATLLQASKADLIPQSLQKTTATRKTGTARTQLIPSTGTPRISGHAPSARGPARPSVDHRPVHVSWQLDSKRKLEAAPKPFRSNSREYWQDVSADALRHGLKLPVSSPDALIRLSPEGGNFGKLDPQRMRITRGAHTLSATRASTHMANAAQLRQAGMPASDGSMIVKLKPAMGTGPVTLKADDAQGRYVVHVYEPHSPLVLHAQTTRDTIASGQSMRMNVNLSDSGRSRAMDAVGGFLMAPDGHTRNLRFQRDGHGSYHVNVTPDASHANGRGLWEMHTFTSATDNAGQTVLRDATTAFAVSVTDAQLDGRARIDTHAGGASVHGTHQARSIDIRLGVQAVSASRYAVSGVLYGHAADGSMKPMAYAQSANWLRPGHSMIDLRFDAGSLAASTLQPPYELRDLRLKDQAHMGLLERRSVALRFSP